VFFQVALAFVGNAGGYAMLMIPVPMPPCDEQLWWLRDTVLRGQHALSFRHRSYLSVSQAARLWILACWSGVRALKSSIALRSALRSFFPERMRIRQIAPFDSISPVCSIDSNDPSKTRSLERE